MVSGRRSDRLAIAQIQGLDPAPLERVPENDVEQGLDPLLLGPSDRLHAVSLGIGGQCLLLITRLGYVSIVAPPIGQYR